LGSTINIYTDHKKLTFNIDNTNSRVLRWRLFIEGFQPTFHYIPGPENIEADGLSQVPTLPSPVGQEDQSYNNDLFYFEKYLIYPDPDPDNPIYHLDYNVNSDHQENDQHLLNLQNNYGDIYQNIIFNGISLICFMPQRNTP
jgi:hypothetical protein